MTVAAGTVALNIVLSMVLSIMMIDEKGACFKKHTQLIYFIHDLECKNQTLFMTKMAKIDTLFISKTAEKLYPLGLLCIPSGAIIGDGDRKFWDPRAPMIWDNFSIFRTNCAILTSYIRADPRTCRGLSRGCCHVE